MLSVRKNLNYYSYLSKIFKLTLQLVFTKKERNFAQKIVALLLKTEMYQFYIVPYAFVYAMN